jgi:membrane protein implicated in regulation of membrane protease activity
VNGISSYLLELGAWNWLILAALFLALEIMAPGIFLVWFGIAAALVGVLALMVEIAWQWQLVLFAVLSVAAVYLAQKYLRGDGEEPSDRPLLNRRALQHVGKSYVLAEPIENGRGTVKIGDSLWRVEGPDAPQGKRVTVTGADGTVLQVKLDG